MLLTIKLFQVTLMMKYVNNCYLSLSLVRLHTAPRRLPGPKLCGLEPTVYPAVWRDGRLTGY